MTIRNDLLKAEGFLTSKKQITLYTGVWLAIGIFIGISLVMWIF